jgi:hypothetical protein
LLCVPSQNSKINDCIAHSVGYFYLHNDILYTSYHYAKIMSSTTAKKPKSASYAVPAVDGMLGLPGHDHYGAFFPSQQSSNRQLAGLRALFLRGLTLLLLWLQNTKRNRFLNQ